MNKYTIQQLQQMRKSEDRIEFKAGEGGNVSYDGRGKTNPKDHRRCILGYVIALCNEGGGRLVIGLHDNYPHHVTGTRQAQDAIELPIEENHSDKELSYMDKQKRLHANAYAPWLNEEESTLSFLYRQGKTVKELAIILQRNEGSISSRLRKLGLN